MHQSEPLAYRLRQAAQLLGISQRVLWQMARDGEIPCAYIGTGRRKLLLFPVESLKAWLLERAERNQVGAAEVSSQS